MTKILQIKNLCDTMTKITKETYYAVIDKMPENRLF
jgi:hypothetical protein